MNWSATNNGSSLSLATVLPANIIQSAQANWINKVIFYANITDPHVHTPARKQYKFYRRFRVARFLECIYKPIACTSFDIACVEEEEEKQTKRKNITCVMNLQRVCMNEDNPLKLT